MERVSKSELSRLRNEVEISALIRFLDIPWKKSEGYFRYLCPLCSDFHTATNPRTNLARCFRCEKNLNPIDLVMLVWGKLFLEAVHYLHENEKAISVLSVHQISRERDHRLA